VISISCSAHRGVPVWYFSGRKCRYDLYPPREVPVWHTVPLQALAVSTLAWFIGDRYDFCLYFMALLARAAYCYTQNHVLDGVQIDPPVRKGNFWGCSFRLTEKHWKPLQRCHKNGWRQGLK